VIYGYIPLIAVTVLVTKFFALPRASTRSKCAVGGIALASVLLFFLFPAWRLWLLAIQVALGVYLTFYILVVSDAK
jgi:hypothetical protein